MCPGRETPSSANLVRAPVISIQNTALSYIHTYLYIYIYLQFVSIFIYPRHVYLCSEVFYFVKNWIPLTIALKKQ